MSSFDSVNSPKSIKFQSALHSIQKQDENNLLSGESFSCIQNPFEEVGLHRQFCKTVEEMKLARLCSKEAEETPTNNNVNVTPKSQKRNPSDVKRWASVVKAQKKIEQSPETNVCNQQTEEGSGITSEIFDCIFKIFPKSLENHKRFITASKNLFFCNICVVELDSVISLSNHIKTRNHEDSIIKFLKEKLPGHLDHTMEFVSFYSSNLCCNLCRCRIAMSSDNPYETIVNIIGHNTDADHASRKAEHEIYSQAKNLLKSLTLTNLEIKDNAHFIENKMNPQFKCKLCNKNILYDENLEVLVQNFTSHLRSVGHIKNQKAVEILKLFGEASGKGKDNFVVSNGVITCNYCNQEVETDLEKLISHENGVEHAKDVFAKLEITPSFNKLSEVKSNVQENKMNEVKSFIPKNDGIVENDKSQQNNEVKPHTDSRLYDLLNTMPSGIKHVDCLIENDKGSVTCLTCNRVVPPSTYNLRTHLLGSNHKKNEALKKGLKFEEVKSNVVSKVLQKKQDCQEISRPTDKTLGTLRTTLKLITLLKPLRGNVASINCIVKNDKHEVICLICQCCVTPVPDHIHEHCMTKEHKEKEKLWFKNCPGCPKQDLSFLEKIPKALRVYKCRHVHQIPSTILNQFYSLLLKKNSLVLENEHVLVKSVDGVNSYCKLCKSLIRLSMDFSDMEENIVSHLNGKRHNDNLIGQDKTTGVISKTASSNSGKVVRSLFLYSNDKPVINTKLQDYQSLHYDFGYESHNPFISITTVAKEHTKLPQGGKWQITNKSQTATGADGLTPSQRKALGDLILSVAQKMYPKLACRVTCLVLKKNESELLSMLENEHTIKLKIEEVVKVLQTRQTKQDSEEKDLQSESSVDSQKSSEISDKADRNDQTNLENSRNLFKESHSSGARKALPVKKASCLLRFEAETDDEVLNRRQKQISYGKNTEGYSRYCQLMPRNKRSLYHPITPPKHVKCSRRTWDGMVRAWRRHLHDWDPPIIIDASVHSDIKPLMIQDNAAIKV